MKIASKILLTVLLLFSFSFPLADRAYAMAQITMVNRSQLTLNLYIDGNFGCGPVLGVGHFTNSPGLFCTSTVTPGPHRLEARNGDKVVQHEDDVNIGDGTSPTWTVNYEEQATIEGVWEVKSDWDDYRIGARYTIVREGDGYKVNFSSPNPNAKSGSKNIGLWYGTPSRIMVTYTLSFDDLVYMFCGANEPSDAQRSRYGQLAGKITAKQIIALSSDGRSVEKYEDRPEISYDVKTGRLLNYKLIPAPSIWVRVSTQ